MRYISIRYTGINVGDQAGNEIQGLTLGAVGAGTTIEYIESFASADDGFEFFGGTVNTRYLVSVRVRSLAMLFSRSSSPVRAFSFMRSAPVGAVGPAVKKTVLVNAQADLVSFVECGGRGEANGSYRIAPGWKCENEYGCEKEIDAS
jgi:hypothetical protein